jgi:hypothetical protein
VFFLEILRNDYPDADELSDQICILYEGVLAAAVLRPKGGSWPRCEALYFQNSRATSIRSAHPLLKRAAILPASAAAPLLWSAAAYLY